MLRFTCVLYLVAASLSAGICAEPEEKSMPPEASQFDFWVGHWQVSWKGQDGADVHGTNTVTKILNGRVLHESFKDPGSGFEGMSYTLYDTTKHKWLQTWVDNTGSYLDFVGEFKDKTVTMQRVVSRGGKEFRQRMRWFNIRKDSFDWNWERSNDGGATWTLLWHIRYTRSEREEG